MNLFGLEDDFSRYYDLIRKDEVESLAKVDSKIFIQLNLKEYEDPLIYSARTGSSKVAIYLLNKHYYGAGSYDVRSKAFLAASQKGSIEILRALVSAGVDVNYSEGGLISPLWASLDGKHASAFMYLLSIGADFKFINKKGENLLFPAICFGDLDVIKKLIDLGVDKKISIVVEGQDTTLNDIAAYCWKNEPKHLGEIEKLINGK